MKTAIKLTLALLFTVNAYSSDGSVKFMSDPSLSPDGKTIVFSYQGDIWKVDASGGTAYRITAMPGSETLPRYSPDGNWIAFSGNQDGNANIYAVPVNGGEISQLTFHQAFDYIDSWSWDSKYIYFTSGRSNSYSAYRVSIEGGTPVRLFSEHYWNTAHFVIPHPVTGEFIFSESGESFRNNNRKRYKGENNPDIKLFNEETGDFRQLTDYEGKDLWPTLNRSGDLYFASDEGTGEYNLFTFLGEKKERLTYFDSSIGRPQASADANLVVFTLDYEIHSYNTETRETRKVPVSIFGNNPLKTEIAFNTEGEITAYDVSPDNKKIAFVSRGRLFVSDIKGKFIKEIRTDPLERVIEVVWVSDNKNLVISRTYRGWPNIFRISADANSSEILVNASEKTARLLSVNSKRDKLVYYSGKDELRLLDLKSFSDKLLLNDEFWFRGTTPRFSYDDRFVYYTAYRNFEQDIFVYDLNGGKKINLTDTYLTESDPFWSPDGKYIYFVADRTQASYPRGGSNTKLYRIPVQKFSEPFRSDEITRILEDKKPTTAGSFADIDTSDLLMRWESPLRYGPRQSNPYVITRDTVTSVLFTSTHEGSPGLYKLTLNPFEENKTEKISGISGGEIVNSGKDFYALSGGNIYKLNLKGNKTEKIEIKHNFIKNLAEEFRQMFYEGWTILAENYYDENMHGTDWPGMRTKYEKFLDDVTSREEMRIVMNDMLGELNSSHMGFRSSGDEEKLHTNLISASTGILFEKNDPYKVSRIVNLSPSDNIYTNISKGDILNSVNGVPVDRASSREKFLLFPAMPEEITLELVRDGKVIETKIHPATYSTVNRLLYDEWIANNQAKVDELSGQSIGYVYLKDMSTRSLDQFLIEMTSEEVDKKAIIVDLRYNTGGNIHDDVLKFLSQRPYLNWKFREGMISPQPHFAPSGKPIALLVNQQSLSDAEMTSAGFRELGLGTIIGTETYRWIIFTTSASLVDGSSCRLPAWGCYTLDGTDLEFSGVEPDIYIRNSFIDRVKGSDPQLEKAVEVLKEKIK
ncbi:MAG TPA: S41 family peptidase [Bacteroidales bacterium]|nr:S41 family peptidase [Bacteroidales bacterium]